MARIGNKYPRYAIFDTTAKTYGGAKTLGKEVSCKVALTLASAELYADDELDESNYDVVGGTVTLGINDDDDTVFAPLLGHTIATTETTFNANDEAPIVGFGHIVHKIVDGAHVYKVEFLNQVKFKEPNSETKTKGASIEFATPELEGKIIIPSDGNWKKTKSFTTVAEAETYLDGLLGTTGA